MNTALLTGTFVGIQAGAALFVSQILIDTTGVGALGLLRYFIALLVLLPVLYTKKFLSVPAKDWWWLSLLGIGQIGLMITLLNLAILYTTAARVALVFATLPAISLLINRMLRTPSAGPYANLGIFFSIAGVVALVGIDAITGSITDMDLIGIGLTLTATIIFALCSALYKPFVKTYGSSQISVIAIAVSLLPLALLIDIFPPQVALVKWDWVTWALILGLGISSGIGYLTWFHTIKNMPTTATGFLALNPITATMLAYAVEGTNFTPSMAVSLVLVCSGLICFALPFRARVSML